MSDDDIMAPFTRVFRHLRPEHPDATVYYVDAGAPNSPNVYMAAKTSQGKQSVNVLRTLYREADAIVNPPEVR